MALPEIASYWMGERLSFIEQLCLKSFADLGHKTTLYSYENISNVPDGVELRDGREVLDEAVFFEFKKLNAAAVFSDKFRLHMLAKTNAIWVDCDAYAWAPFPDNEYIFARDVPTRLASGVLRLPKDSEALQLYLKFVSTSYPVFPSGWPNNPNLSDATIAPTRAVGTKHVSDAPMWSWGPVALTYFLKKTGEIEHEMPGELFYPLEGMSINYVFKPYFQLKRKSIPENCLSVHLFGSLLRRKLRRRFPDGDLPEKSFLNFLCKKHGINPREFPVI